MTRKEARKTLVHFAVASENQITMAIDLQCRKAIEMAIKALEQPEPCEDTISRQAAIDLVEGLESARLKGEIDLLYPKVVKGLIGLPSAQLDYDKVIAEIKQCISETREHGKHHAKFVQDNGELYISGLEMALSIIEENR